MAMPPGAGKSRRKSSFAFPHQPVSERGRFLRYMEESGATAVFSEVFSALYNEPDKPENPLGWISNYLRAKAGERKEILNSTLESRRNDIIEAALELEQLKLQKNHHDQLMQDVEHKLSRFAKGAQKESIDETFVEDGGDSRWQIQPDPMFVGSWSKDEVALQLANINGSAVEAEDDIEDGLIIVEEPNCQVSDFPSEDDTAYQTPALGNSEFQSTMTMTISASAKDAAKVGFEFEHSPLSDPNLNTQSIFALFELAEKSTETSPQPSSFPLIQQDGLQPESDEAEENIETEMNMMRSSFENIPVPPPTENGIFPPYKGVGQLETSKDQEQISDDFWKDDFTLGKVDSENSDEEYEYFTPELSLIRNKLLHGKRYRAKSFQEHNWLPWQSGHYGNETLQVTENESEIIIDDPMGRITVTNLARPDTEIKISGEPDHDHEEIKLKVKHHLAKYEWIKKEHGVQHLRPLLKGGVIMDDLKNKRSDETMTSIAD